MGYYFPIILFLLTLLSGICYLFFLMIPKTRHESLNTFIPFRVLRIARDFFWVFFIVLIIRSFIASLYSVPTGSLEPTVMPGDILITTKYNYGLYMPVWHNKIIAINNPQRGDIILFRDPVHPKTTLIKRLIGIPGDHISYIDKILYINGKKMSQHPLGNAIDIVQGHKIPATQLVENLNGLQHTIFVNPNIKAQNFYNLVVPKGHYFAMGDNRDYSDDSRYWGFVPADNIFAKGQMVILNFKHWHRIGTQLYPF